VPAQIVSMMRPCGRYPSSTKSLFTPTIVLGSSAAEVASNARTKAVLFGLVVVTPSITVVVLVPCSTRFQTGPIIQSSTAAPKTPSRAHDQPVEELVENSTLTSSMLSLTL